MNREDRRVLEAYVQAVLSEREHWLYQSALNKVRITRARSSAPEAVLSERITGVSQRN